MNTKEILELARKHVRNGAAMESSALLCLEDAENFARSGVEAIARNRAVASLKYSVGIFHCDYQKAKGALS